VPEPTKISTMQEQAARSQRLTEREQQFARLVEIDKIKDRSLEKDADFDEIDHEIVGLQRKKVEDLSKEDQQKKLTVA